MSSFAWTKKAVFTITGGLYHFVTGNGYWIFTMTETASEESLEKFVWAARMWIILSSGTMKLIYVAYRAPKVCRGPEKVDLYASEYIEAQRIIKPSIYASEIRQRLFLDGVLHPIDLPSSSQINKPSRNEHAMTRKKIYQWFRVNLWPRLK